MSQPFKVGEHLQTSPELRISGLTNSLNPLKPGSTFRPFPWQILPGMVSQVNFRLYPPQRKIKVKFQMLIPDRDLTLGQQQVRKGGSLQNSGGWTIS